MRLTKIKLAGFKSFVDPTSVGFPTQPGRRGRAQRLRQVQHHRRGALGHGRDLRQAPARRLDGRRHLQRLGHAQAGGHRLGRADLRQQRRQARRRVRRLFGGLAQARGLARRPVVVLPQRRALPAQGHHAAVPRHGPRLAQLRDHRAGHDLARDRGARPTTCAPSSRRRPASRATRSAAGDREPHRAHAREPRAPDRPARRGREAVPAPAAPGGHGAALPGAEAGRAPGRTPSCSRCGCARSRTSRRRARRS